jgi:SulP family sulfate permease
MPRWRRRWRSSSTWRLFGGILKLVWIADLRSRVVLAGYVFGSGLLVIGSQSVALFGLHGVETALYAFDPGAIIRDLDQTNVTALAIGLGSIAVVLGLRLVNRKIPGALVLVVSSIVLVALLGLDDQVDVVVSFPR